MRSQRTDFTIILLCAVPVVAGVFVWLGWEATGDLPFIGAATPPTLSVPSLPAYNVWVPSGILDFAYNVRDHWLYFLVGVVISSLAFLMLSGAWVDWQVKRRQRRWEFEEREEAENAADAPWMQSEETS